MDQVVGTRATACTFSATGATAVFGFTNLPAQTVSAGVWSLVMYWGGGTGLTRDTVTITAGAVAGASCAAFVGTIPNPGTTWTTTVGSNGINTTSPATISTSAGQAALVIPSGGSLCVAVTLTHNTGGRISMLYDGTAGVADSQLIPPSTVVPESLLGFIGLALFIPLITARRRVLALLRLRR
jgi:hypothetical protein